MSKWQQYDIIDGAPDPKKDCQSKVTENEDSTAHGSCLSELTPHGYTQVLCVYEVQEPPGGYEKLQPCFYQWLNRASYNVWSSVK